MTDAEAPRLVLRAEPEKGIAERTRTIVVGPYLVRRAGEAGDGASRSPEARLDEAVGLTRAIDLTVVSDRIVPLRAFRPATYLGKGALGALKDEVEAQEARLVMMDCALSPVQQRNLEKELGTKVIDRTGLILEIFGRRASTREGTLQVELAHLAYQKSRLVRSWTHLERQRGGFGFLGGPGETQIEADRRLIQERMSRLERDLEEVKRTRGLHRKSRDKVPYPTIALVGYTNAGKSSLFNRMTDAAVLAKDMLFATLDPTTRAITLPHGMKAILSDTVGFISDLPTQLIAAFRATLEDVVRADVILHVRDIAAEESDAQSADVTHILAELGIEDAETGRIIEVWNKADLLSEADRAVLAHAGGRAKASPPVLVSAVTGEGVQSLLAAIEARLTRDNPVVSVIVPPVDGAGLHWLYQAGEVLSRADAEDGAHLIVRLRPERLAEAARRFPGLISAAAR